VNPIVSCRGSVSDFTGCFWYFVTVVEMLDEAEAIIDSRVCFLSDELGKLILRDVSLHFNHRSRVAMNHDFKRFSQRLYNVEQAIDG